MKLREILLISFTIKICLVSICALFFYAHNMIGEDAQAPIWFSSIATLGEVKEALFGNFDKVNVFNSEGVTGLMVAAAHMNFDIMQLLVEHGASINITGNDKNGDTPLHLACYNGGNVQASVEDTLKIIKYLIDRGADVNARNRGGGYQAPMHRAMQIQELGLRMRVLDLLRMYGANINAQDSDGSTILHISVNRNELEGIDKLLNNFWRLVGFDPSHIQDRQTFGKVITLLQTYKVGPTVQTVGEELAKIRKSFEEWGLLLNLDIKNQKQVMAGSGVQKSMTAQEYAYSLGFRDAFDHIKNDVERLKEEEKKEGLSWLMSFNKAKIDALKADFDKREQEQSKKKKEFEVRLQEIKMYKVQ